MEKWLEPYALSAFRRSADVAHDLKTPLNVAVLNLELLRMRVRKVAGEDDAKAEGYLKAIDIELRRMARIFDAYFVFSSPLRDAEPPAPVDVKSLVREFAGELPLPPAGESVALAGHRGRLKELFRLLSEGARKIFEPDTLLVTESVSPESYHLTVAGKLTISEADVGKIFKFYYTDASGSPDLSLATARLITETCGGTLDLVEDLPSARFELSLPLGER